MVFTLLVCGHTLNELKWLKEWTFQTFVTNCWLTLSIQSFRQAVWYGFFVQCKKLYDRLIDGAANADRIYQCLCDLDLDFGRWSIDLSRSAKTDRSSAIDLDQQPIAASLGIAHLFKQFIIFFNTRNRSRDSNAFWLLAMPSFLDKPPSASNNNIPPFLANRYSKTSILSTPTNRYTSIYSYRNIFSSVFSYYLRLF